MPLHWTDKQRATRHLAQQFLNAGWTLWGYDPGESDPMTDCFRPGHWEGAATHPNHPTYVVCCNVSDYTIRHQENLRPTPNTPSAKPTYIYCETCKGIGYLDNTPWTIQTALMMPEIFNAEMNRPPNTAINPQDFNENGLPICKCKKTPIDPTIGTVFPAKPTINCATPKGRMWHIEHNGHMITSGTGFAEAMQHPSRGNGPKVIFDRIITAITTTPPQPILNAPANDEPDAETIIIDGMTCKLTRPTSHQIHIYFPDKPSKFTRERMKRGLSARWNPDNVRWEIYGRNWPTEQITQYLEDPR